MVSWVLNDGVCLTRAPIQCWFPESVRVSASSDVDESAGAPGLPDWEVACIQEVQNGKPDAFNPLVAHYAPRIRAYLVRMVRSHEEAEDLTQETFLKAFQALPRFDAERPFKRWLYTIATNTGLNAIRARNRRGTPVEIDTERLPGLAATGDAAKAGHKPGPEERLEDALAELPDRARQLIALHYHEGFTLQEAGDMLGISEGAAKVALCRARRQLRIAMSEGINDEL